MNKVRTIVFLLLAVISAAFLASARPEPQREGTSQRIESAGLHSASGGGMFNVKSYGAVGNGLADDTSALSSAIRDCNAKSGVVFLPAGKYRMTRSLPAITGSCSILGSGEGASVVEASSRIGSLISLDTAPHLDHPAYYAGPFFEHFGVVCNTKAEDGTNTLNVGIHLIDTTMTKFFDVSVANCRAGFEEEGKTAINERNEFIDVNLFCNTDGWLLQQDPQDTTLNSFYHQTWIGDYVMTGHQPNENVFHLTGGAQMMMSYIQFNGNINGAGATLFELDGGSAMIDTTLDVLPESGSPHGHGYVFGESGPGPADFRNVCQSNLACVKVVGHIVGELSNFGTKGSQWSIFRVEDELSAPNYLGTLTTTAHSADVFVSRAILGHTNTTSCFFVPTNQIAAGMVNTTYVGAINFQNVVIHHPPTAGGKFQIWCN